MSDVHPLTRAIIAGRRKEVSELVKQCLAAGESAASIVEQRLVPGMTAAAPRRKRIKLSELWEMKHGASAYTT